MKRLFLVHSDDLPTDNVGHWHFIELGSHGNAGQDYHVCCLYDPHIIAPVNWVAFPRFTNVKTKLKDVLDHTLLADLGLTGDETSAEAAEVFETIHPLVCI